MTAYPGYYSLIQYCPDAARLETVNVGVAIFCPQQEYLDVAMAENNDRVLRVFRGYHVQERSLTAAKLAIAARLRSDNYRPETLEEFQQFIDSRANELLMTAPRAVKVFDPAQELDELYARLVLDRTPSARTKVNRKAPLSPELQGVFMRLVKSGRAQRRIKVKIPLLGTELQVPFAYRRRTGVVNLVKPQQFSATEESAKNSAVRLAVQGDMLAKHGKDEHGDKRLVVLAGFENRTQHAVRETVLGILNEYHVKAVPPEAVHEYAQEVEREAA